MNSREREHLTLSFVRPPGRGAVQETFYPWTETIEVFLKDGLPQEIAAGILSPRINSPDLGAEKYLSVAWSEGCLAYEKYLGLDAVRRAAFFLPFRRIPASHPLGLELLPRLVRSMEDWKRILPFSEQERAAHFTNEKIEQIYGPLRMQQEQEGCSIRLFIEGFFWAPREMMGIERHLYAFYDAPELIHAMNQYALEVYLDRLPQVLKVLPADVLYIMEDLSGKNGPMLSPRLFDEFVGEYYRQLNSKLKKNGVRHVFVDTDGDFHQLIPNFIKAGVEGFLPMDVNAGMDIAKVREQYPHLKFIGGFNKLAIAAGKAAIDAEFERILPVIRQGGYIPGCDHQVAPTTSLENYRYYLRRLADEMTHSGSAARAE